MSDTPAAKITAETATTDQSPTRDVVRNRATDPRSVDAADRVPKTGNELADQSRNLANAETENGRDPETGNVDEADLRAAKDGEIAATEAAAKTVTTRGTRTSRMSRRRRSFTTNTIIRTSKRNRRIGNRPDSLTTTVPVMTTMNIEQGIKFQWFLH
jgi:hypothetical protein